MELACASEGPAVPSLALKSRAAAARSCPQRGGAATDARNCRGRGSPPGSERSERSPAAKAHCMAGLPAGKRGRNRRRESPPTRFPAWVGALRALAVGAVQCRAELPAPKERPHPRREASPTRFPTRLAAPSDYSTSSKQARTASNMRSLAHSKVKVWSAPSRMSTCTLGLPRSRARSAPRCVASSSRAPSRPESTR